MLDPSQPAIAQLGVLLLAALGGLQIAVLMLRVLISEVFSPLPEGDAASVLAVEPEPLYLDLDGRFVLAGRPVATGDTIEILLPGGAWLPAELRPEPDGWPAVWVTLGGPWEHQVNGLATRRPYLAARVSPDAQLRRLRA